MATHIGDTLDVEKAAVEAKLAALTPAPSPYETAILNRSLDIIARMRQGANESAVDYRLRVNQIAQASPAGSWSTSFWSQVEAAIQAEHGENVMGGVGRNKDV